jgi:hypothetical protein
MGNSCVLDGMQGNDEPEQMYRRALELDPLSPRGMQHQIRRTWLDLKKNPRCYRPYQEAIYGPESFRVVALV